MWLRKLLGIGSADPLHSAFGTLEREVLRILWAEGELAVRDVQARLSRDIAYTTVMTTLDRLYKKAVLTRVQSGRAFVYSAALSRDDLQAVIAGRVLSGLLTARDGDAVPVLSHLVDTVGRHDAALLTTLERMIKAKRDTLATRRTTAPRKSRR